MGDPLVGCASYIFWNFMSNYMARRPHISQYPNVETSAVAIMCAKLIACHTSGQTKEDYPVWKPSTSLSETSPRITFVTLHLSHYICHITFVTLHSSHYIRHITFVTLHLSQYICHITFVTLHLSQYICHITFVT